jgi:glycosyltransferase involved in cell wall biosynthesis
MPIRVLHLNGDQMGHASSFQYYRAGAAVSTGGVEVDFHSLREEFSRSAAVRWQYRMVSWKLPGVHGDGDYFRFRTEWILSQIARKAVLRLARKKSYQVVHWHSQGIALAPADLGEGVAQVVSLDITTAILSRVHAAAARRTYGPIIEKERECFQRMDRVVSWSRYAADSLVKDYGVPEEKIEVIAPGLPEAWFSLEREAKGPEKKLRLLFVGNDWIRKGGADILDVAAEIFPQEVELDIVSARAAPAELPANVRWHSHLPAMGAELLDLYAKADAFVLPTYEDCFPVALLEAMAAGLPCLAGRTLGVPEIVEDGVTGRLCQPGDRGDLARAVGDFLRDAEGRRAMGRAARVKAQSHYELSANRGRWDRVYVEAAGRKQ